MEDKEIIEIMQKPIATIRTPLYRAIYAQATGKAWNQCFCGNGWQRFIGVCKNYALTLKNKTINNNPQL